VAEKHEGALACDNADAVLVAEIDGPLVYGARSTGPAMHPDVVHVGGSAVVHSVFRAIGRSEQESRFDRRVDLGNTGKTALALDFGRARIHRDDVVTLLLELPENGPAEVVGVTRNADYRQSFVRQELVDGFTVCHNENRGLSILSPVFYYGASADLGGYDLRRQVRQFGHGLDRCDRFEL
jgi:hypothetical protein